VTGDGNTKRDYIERVTRGEGWMPWQKREAVSPAEREFREQMERRKDAMRAGRTAVAHPVMLDDAQIACARRNIDGTSWGAAWFRNVKLIAHHVAAQPDAYVRDMIPELTPTNPYGLTCPRCVGVESQEGMAYRSIQWDYRTPDVIRCSACGQTYPHPDYPETGVLACPRTDQTFTYYLNEAERANPEDRSGKLAWKWVGKPVHSSFSGFVRGKKIAFMTTALRNLTLVYRLTDSPHYAHRAVQILHRLADCYPRWLYHDFYDTVADCDPLYAAWHDMDLKLEWKRHLSDMAYGHSQYETGLVDDTPDRAKMLATYFGCGRIHPSVDSISSHLGSICLAYDLVYDAHDEDGAPLWTDDLRRRVEKNLILEYILTAEPFVGGTAKPPDLGNKSPSVYHAMAAVGVCLGLPEFVDIALKGYDGLRDKSFIYDGFSKESPAYTNMYLSSFIHIPETLHGFRWPEGFPGRRGTVDLFRSDPKLRRILQTALEQLRPDGAHLPLSDTQADSAPSPHIFEVGLKRYPERFVGKLPALYRGGTPSEYAVFHLTEKDLAQDTGLDLPETLFPAWMTAVLRHGAGPESSVLALPFNPAGGHRQADNLSIYYWAGGRALLGEQGYVGDSPMNRWVRGTSLSHNLVIVDGQEQRFRNGKGERLPRLGFMATSPRVSVVEASASVYDPCRDYRRLVALFKGSDARTFALDIFRVKGGGKHAYRLFSELAASDATDGALVFHSLDMPPEPPLPDFGSSVDPEHIFGLRDIRRAENPPASWQATWQEADRRYRLWMLSSCHAVEASNGPGQETLEQSGRRVRYVDAVNEGQDLVSAFVALHEPGGPGGALPVRRAERLSVPEKCGADAIALRIVTQWGTYRVFSEIEREVEIDGIRFCGAFGVYAETSESRPWYFTVNAATLRRNETGFERQPRIWSGRVISQTETDIQTDVPAPAGWTPPSQDVTAWIAVDTNTFRTGFPVASADDHHLSVDRFPLPPVTAFELPAVRYGEA